MTRHRFPPHACDQFTSLVEHLGGTIVATPPHGHGVTSENSDPSNLSDTLTVKQ